LVGTGTVAAQSAPDCSTVTYNGDGTESNPYEVGDVNQLQCINDQGLDASYEAISDIDASETASWNGGSGFDPIDNNIESFTGTFDGGDHTITDLTINRPSEDGVALFRAVGDGTGSGKVKDIRLEGVDVTGSAGVASLAGSTLGTVTGSYASGTVTGDTSVAGLVGTNQAGTVSESVSSVDVAGSGSFGQAGGLVGANFGTIEDSQATGDVSGTSKVGGLVGRNDRGSVIGEISKSYATGNVDGDDFVGGLVGNTVAGEVRESYATGEVSADGRAGGFIGQNFGTVSDSYATGSVNSVNGRGGGFVGYNDAPVRNSYSTGAVTARQSGGFIASQGSSATTEDGYWDTESSGISFSIIGIGLTTSEMTGSAATSNMTGFDFTNIWATVTDPDDYPILVWQQPTPSFTLSTNNPTVGEAVTFDASASSDRDGTIQTYEWDFDGDGTTDVTRSAPLVTHTYDAPGEYAVTLTVTDDDGATDTLVKTVEVRDPSTSPVDGVSDALWTAVTQDDGSDGLSLADLGNAIQEYRANPSDADVDGVSITLSDLGSLIQYYRTEVV